VKRNAKIFELWMQCYTQEAIAEAIDCPQQTVTDQIKSFTETVPGNQSGKAFANHETGFDIPIYNVWKQQTKTDGSTQKFAAYT
jgi:hypothetical protein